PRQKNFKNFCPFCPARSTYQEMTMESCMPMNAEQGIIREAGFKVTLPRMLELKILRACHEGGEHLNAETIYKRIIDGGDQISLAAVYRILSQFEAAGLVIRHQFLSGPSHGVYELAE